MNTVNISSAVNVPSSLSIGKQGESDVTEVVFDFSPWVEEFGEGSVQLLVLRNGDTDPYPAALIIDGTTAIWEVSNADTQYKGLGKLQYLYIVDNQVAKTCVFYTIVEQSLSEDTEEPPEPYQSWVDQVLAAAALVESTLRTGFYTFTDDGDGNIVIGNQVNEET